jgi:hypothetical protein
MWYDGNRTLTHNCLFNFVIGNRGCGKSYWAKKWAVKDFIKNNEQFIYLRRYDSEFEKIDEFFTDIYKELPEGTETEVRGNQFKINGKSAGFYFPLSTASTLKSTPFPNVTKIIFDEFIIDKGVHRYLNDEVVKFLDFYETVNRLRIEKKEVIVFFISNAITMVNPYTLYFDLRLPYNKNLVKKNDILLELVANKEFIEAKEKTRFGKLIKGTKYAEYSINNEFLRDNTTFVMKKTEKAKYYFTMKYSGMLYGVWVDYSVGKMFVSEDTDPSCKIIYSITIDDHTPNTMLLKRLSQSPMFKGFIENYKLGLVYFESIKVKNVVYDIIRMAMF